MSDSHKEAAASRAAYARERGTIVGVPGGDDQERASLHEVVNHVAEKVTDGSLGAVGGLVAKQAWDKVKGGGSEPPPPPSADDDA